MQRLRSFSHCSTNVGTTHKAGSRRSNERAAGVASQLSLLRDLKGTFDLDVELADSALQLRVPRQRLHRAMVLRASVYQRRLGPS